MASFDININAQVIDEYVINPSKVFNASTCSNPLDTEWTIGLIEDTYVADPTYHLLTSYSDASSWKTLKIKNVVYSHPLNVYLSDTLVKIPEAGATVYDFDVTGQAVDIAIPNLTFTYDNYSPSGNATVTFDLAIENLASEVGSYTSVTILAEYSKCPSIPVADLLITTISDDGCGIEDTATVTPPAEGERYVVVTANDVYGNGSDTTAGETITTSTDYTLFIDASTAGSVIHYSTVIIQVYNNSSMSVLLDSHQISRNHAGIIC